MERNPRKIKIGMVTLAILVSLVTGIIYLQDRFEKASNRAVFKFEYLSKQAQTENQMRVKAQKEMKYDKAKNDAVTEALMTKVAVDKMTIEELTAKSHKQDSINRILIQYNVKKTKTIDSLTRAIRRITTIPKSDLLEGSK